MESLDYGDQSQQRKSSRELVGLTSGFAGQRQIADVIKSLQIAFSMQFALLTSSLSALGLSHASISTIWLIPPLCGAILQPLLGAWSDVFSNRWGRRRPFIISGAIGLCISLLIFGEVISQSQKRPGHCGYPNACADLQLATLLLVLTINVSATSLQMGLRALMVDVCSDCQQSEVNAWMARLTNASNVFFYLSAYIDLPKLLGWAGQTQLQILTKLSAILIATTQSITCWYARHESRFSAPSIGESLPLENLDSKYWWNSNNNILSRRLWVIQGVQFLSWFAWFPFLAYIGSYVNQISKEEKLLSNHYANILPARYTLREEESNQGFKEKYGPYALLCFALVASMTAVVVPLVCSWLSSTTSSLSARGHGESSYQSNNPQNSAHWKRQIWYTSQLIYTASLIGILLVRSTTSSVMFAGMAGISWAVTQWIPFTLINIEIFRRHQTNGATYRTNQAALIQGLSNVAITAPQILVSLLGTLLFSYVGDNKDDTLVLGTRLLFVICSFASFFAACLLLRLDTE